MIRTFLPVYYFSHNDFKTGERVFSVRCGESVASVNMSPFASIKTQSDIVKKLRCVVQRMEME